MDENGKRIAVWRASKEAEWEMPGSKLRTKHPTRELFEAWLARQADKGRSQAKAKAAAAAIGPPSGWSTGLAQADAFEWLATCYQLRCADDKVGKNGTPHGPSDPASDSNTIKTDFLQFCLAVKRTGAVPAGWSWSTFLKTTATLVWQPATEADAKTRWGAESVQPATTAAKARSLRRTARAIYGTTSQGGGGGMASKSARKAETDAKNACVGTDSDATLDEVGGRDAWEQFVIDLHLSRNRAVKAGRALK